MLPSSVQDELIADCEVRDLKPTLSAYQTGQQIDKLYFINHGVVSLVKTMEDGRSAQVGFAGAEGMIGHFAALGEPAAMFDFMVPMPVQAFGIRRDRFINIMKSHDQLHKIIVHYAFFRAEMIAQLSACNRLHDLSSRCCLWLVLIRDNVDTDDLLVTQDRLAALLGVRRPSLSVVVKGLQEQGFIQSGRGRLHMRDRGRLEVNACECYRTVKSMIDERFPSSGASI
jgi:CRP-like cAMP-binding protein